MRKTTANSTDSLQQQHLTMVKWKKENFKDNDYVRQMLQEENELFHGKKDQPIDVIESHRYLDEIFVKLMNMVKDRAAGFNKFIHLSDMVELIENVQDDIHKRYMESTGQVPGSYQNVVCWEVPQGYSSYGASSSSRLDVSHRQAEWHSSSSTSAQYALTHRHMLSYSSSEPQWHQGTWNQSNRGQDRWWLAPHSDSQWQPTPTWSLRYNHTTNSTWDTSGYGPTINNRSNQQRYNRSDQIPYRARTTRGDSREYF